MKKGILVLIFIYLTVVAGLTYINLNFTTESYLLNNTEPVVVTKPEEMQTSEFVSYIQEASSKYKIDISYKTSMYKEGIFYTELYITNNNNLFTKITNTRLDYPQSGEVLSTSNDTLFDPSTFGELNVYNFSDVSKYALSENVFYLAGESSQTAEFTEFLKSDGIEIEDSKMNATISNFNLYQLKFLLLFLIVTCMILNSLLQISNNTIMRLCGYSNLDIIKQRSKQFGISLLKVVCLILLFSTILLILYNENIFYIESAIIFAILKSGLLFSCLFIITNLFIFIERDINGLKQNSNTKLILTFMYGLKLAVVVLLSVNLVSITQNIKDSIDVYQSSQFIIENMSDYATLPINILGLDFSTDLQDEIDEKAIQLYELTSDELDGMIIDSSNYNYMQGFKTPCDEFNQCSIRVNEQYLQNSNINIIEDNIDSSKLNVLIPIGFKGQEEAYVDGYNSDLINVSYYANESRFYVFDPETNTGTNQNYLEGIPVELISDSDAGYELSGKNYYVKVDVSDPYSTVKPYINQINGDKFFKSAELVSNSYIEKIAELRVKILLASMQLIVYFISYIVLIMYMNNIYIKNNMVRYINYYLNGYSIFTILKPLLIFTLITYGLSIIWFNQLLLIMLLIFDIVFSIQITKNILKKQTLINIKKEN